MKNFDRYIPRNREDIRKMLAAIGVSPRSTRNASSDFRIIDIDAPINGHGGFKRLDV